MQRTKIAQLFADVDAFGGKEITVAGWVRSVRDMKNFGFVTLNDGSCFRDLQVVMSRETLENYDEIAAQNVSAALICKGTLKLTPEAQQPFELTAESISVEGISAPDYPSFCAPSSISVRARTCFAPFSASAASRPHLSTAFSRTADSSM